jgi:NADH-quinone oxidoreductase subunit A
VPETFLPESYLPVLIFLIIASGFAIGTLAVGWLLRPSRPYARKLSPYESGNPPFSDARQPFPIRYYIIAMLFVIFDIEAVFLYPWAVAYNKIGLYALIEMILFIIILFVGYIYALGKGALDWES